MSDPIHLLLRVRPGFKERPRISALCHARAGRLTRDGDSVTCEACRLTMAREVSLALGAKPCPICEGDGWLIGINMKPVTCGGCGGRGTSP